MFKTIPQKYVKNILSYLRKFKSAKESYITWENNSLGFIEGVYQR